jgi:hypothetical protein
MSHTCILDSSELAPGTLLGSSGTGSRGLNIGLNRQLLSSICLTVIVTLLWRLFLRLLHLYTHRGKQFKYRCHRAWLRRWRRSNLHRRCRLAVISCDPIASSPTSARHLIGRPSQVAHLAPPVVLCFLTLQHLREPRTNHDGSDGAILPVLDFVLD